MKFSTRATYGLKAMLYLADRYGESATPVSLIAKEEGISAAYLEQIMNKLKNKSWVKSIRGPHGGYVLTTKPADISVGSVLKDLGEDIRIAESQEIKKNEPKIPTAHVASVLFWKRFSNGVLNLLDKTSLQDLVDYARQHMVKELGTSSTQKSAFTFQI